MMDRILLPLDRSSLAECVLPHALGIAKVFNSRVFLLVVLDSQEVDSRTGPVDPLGWRISRAEGEAYLDKVAERLRAQGVQVDYAILEGYAAERTIDHAKEKDIDLIIMSSHGGTGLSQWNLSSVVRKVVQRAHRSTMIIRAYHPPEAEGVDELHYRKILAPMDGSRRAECILSLATAICERHGAELVLTTAVGKPAVPRHSPPTQEEQELVSRLMERNRRVAQEYLDHLEDHLSIPVKNRLLVCEDTALCLHNLVDAEQVDLVLMSAHGYSGKTRWPYGSTATTFIEYGNTALLIMQDVPSEEVEPTEAEMCAREHKGH
ncbi:universal stress protein [bacterium]|nr:universal stress protein [bacterium]